MFKITAKQLLNQTVHKIEVVAPDIARRFSAGQFVTLRVEPSSYSVALSTVYVDPTKGTLALVFDGGHQAFQKLARLKIGDEIFAVHGPLAQSCLPLKFGKVLCVSENNFLTNNLSLCRGLKTFGNKVIGVAGFETKADIILEPQLRANCDDVMIVTNDGSYDRKGTLVDTVDALCLKQNIDCIFSVGPIATLHALQKVIANHRIKHFIHLAAILDFGLKHDYESTIRLNGQRTYLGFSPLIYSSKDIDLGDILMQIQTLKEYDNCQQLITEESRQKGLSGALPRLLAGLIKEKH